MKNIKYKDNIFELEKKLNLNFKNKDLLINSLIHSSFANENEYESNERLEYLGDSVIDLCMAKYLYLTSSEDEGVLTYKRSQAVRTEAHNNYAIYLNLDKFILLGVGEKKQNRAKKICADAFEALFGAIFLEFGFEVAYKKFEEIIVPNLYLNQIRDYKTEFQELMHSQNRDVRYNSVSYEGEPHNRTFIEEVMVGNIRYGIGKGKTRKIAQQNAAKDALSYCVKDGDN